MFSLSQEREKSLAQSTDPGHQDVIILWKARSNPVLYMGVTMTMIIGGVSFVIICHQYYMFQTSLRPKCGRLPNFCLIGVMEKTVKQIILPNPHRISSLPCLLAKCCQVSISPQHWCPCTHWDICYEKPMEAADKDFRRQSHFLSHTPKTLP